MSRLIDTFLGFFESADIENPTQVLNWNVKETEHAFMVSCDVPGVHREDLKVELREGALVVFGKRAIGSESVLGKPTQLDGYPNGKFKGYVTLPSHVDPDGVEALHEDGVLELYLPKIASMTRPRSIPIRARYQDTQAFRKLRKAEG